MIMSDNISPEEPRPEPPKHARRGLTRRAFLGGLAASGILAGGLGLRDLQKILEDSPGGGIFGKFLSRKEDGTPTISAIPEVVKVEYQALSDSTSRYWNGDNIIIRRKPEDNPKGGSPMLPGDIKTEYAIRIAGGTFNGNPDNSRFKIMHKGREYTIGEWFALSNEQGNLVNPNGQLLLKDEKPFYAAANFLTVQEEPTQATQI